MIDGRLDPRSLAIFRMALGLILLNQSGLLSRDFDAFYSMGGVSSPHGYDDTFLREKGTGTRPSIFLFRGNLWEG